MNNADNKKQEMWKLINRETKGKRKSINIGNERSSIVTAEDLNGFFSMAGKGVDPDQNVSIGLLQQSMSDNPDSLFLFLVSEVEIMTVTKK